ncbi:MAG: hypothetical protein KGV51_05895 [Moraxellaceae bacterium]|nr:hypothetical protein [Moraxellaceae bacterium]
MENQNNISNENIKPTNKVAELLLPRLSSQTLAPFNHSGVECYGYSWLACDDDKDDFCILVFTDNTPPKDGETVLVDYDDKLKALQEYKQQSSARHIIGELSIQAVTVNTRTDTVIIHQE